jgi:hypothetical protein
MTITDLIPRFDLGKTNDFPGKEIPVEFTLAGRRFCIIYGYKNGEMPTYEDVLQTITRDLLSTLECNGFTLLPTEE